MLEQGSREAPTNHRSLQNLINSPVGKKRSAGEAEVVGSEHQAFLTRSAEAQGLGWVVNIPVSFVSFYLRRRRQVLPEDGSEAE